ncbi:STAS domain-containing protein [Actinoplanes aureus]|uniref:Anti-sigma factor antagonist n=1 Tax=Actinoplanes aureus TaxID=2792083 RepID=A0A931FY41_9ACTN|nr:STAS domain-containing protein [Actinoplanes aureus]MBG0561481.1 STAS domain-containing protein [Actinoplanes aureus]
MQTVSIEAKPGGVLDVVLSGEIDFTNAAHIVDVVREAIAGGCPETVRVDLAAVTFLDSSGLGVLIRAMKAAAAVDAAFRVEHPTEKVFDQLQMTGLLAPFGIAETGG